MALPPPIAPASRSTSRPTIPCRGLRSQPHRQAAERERTPCGGHPGAAARGRAGAVAGQARRRAAGAEHARRLAPATGDDAGALVADESALQLAGWRTIAPGKVFLLTGIGRARQGLGQHEVALAAYNDALVIDRELGDRRGERIDYLTIASVQQDLDRNEEALASLQQALAISRELADDALVASTLGAIRQPVPGNRSQRGGPGFLRTGPRHACRARTERFPRDAARERGRRIADARAPCAGTRLLRACRDHVPVAVANRGRGDCGAGCRTLAEGAGQRNPKPLPATRRRASCSRRPGMTPGCAALC